MRKLAAEKNVSLDDLVGGVLWQYVKGESEKQVKEMPRENAVPLRGILNPCL
jgi:hypothetical protein